MRRIRAGSGGTLHANRGNAADPLSLIRSFDSENIPTRPVRPSPLSASTFHGLPLDLLDRLRSFPLFISAPDSFLAAIGSHLRPQLHNTHDYVLTEGDDAKAMYWLVRGSLIVTSRDGESTYAELKPGAFFGEIGILMDIPRTATVVAKLKSLVVRLNKEDLQQVLPNYPEVESTIRDEALERLSILERKKKELNLSKGLPASAPFRKGKRPRSMDGEVVMAEAGMLKHGEIVVSSKKRKSPSPSTTDSLASSALGSGSVNVRQTLRELPLFATLPPEILHFIGLNAQPRSYKPFEDIIKQGSTGRDVFFIVRGEVEVVSEKLPQTPVDRPASNGMPVLLLPPEPPQEPVIKARLRPGQYFGEVTSLSLAPRRTATVRSISSVEALMISGDVLDELWMKCTPDLRRQVERTARDRLRSANDGDVQMTDADSTPAIGALEIDDARPLSPTTKGMFSLSETLRADEPPAVGVVDPDPYLNVDLENFRSRSRRGSLAPPSPSTSTPPNEPAQPGDSPSKHSLFNGHNILSQIKFKIDPVSPRKVLANKRARLLRQMQMRQEKQTIPDNVLVNVFKYLDVYDLMKLRLVSTHWMKIISTSPDILHHLDLTPYNRFINDHTLQNVVCPFIGTRPKFVDISNCFHLTDEGFATLAATCAATVKVWRMKSVWDITGQAVLEMANKAKELEEIDLSNCRKVSDNLLARVVGWVVPALDPVEQVVQQQRQQQQLNRRNGKLSKLTSPPPSLPQPGTVVGCPNLKRMTLSYCKHITDRSMAHIATHAASRIEELNLTRCTTITDEGFHFWSAWAFPRLTRLCLADCTYLTDNAIIWLTHAARALTWLDLSFCCALSDIATEVLALGCPSLRHLNLAFCGSAVSDASLRVISRHLLELRELSVRGCVRVTGVGVESVVEGCEKLDAFDVSQCRNLMPWIEGGGREKVWEGGRSVRFCVWAGEPGGWGSARPAGEEVGCADGGENGVVDGGKMVLVEG
ncbi:RNI-like protein [Microthyrium microscopicum]|uniref:RNI-like protein n=1 Tax=Microthyrium microscopicum TaxID=703497 RepID=A0A6A6UCY4_9PEZI|nr:RNI-like protein [Microthyrium microscopicum]